MSTTPDGRTDASSAAVTIVGAGATGGYLAALLTEAGVPVTLVARGESLHRIRDLGLDVTKPDGSTSRTRPYRILAVDDVDEPADLVLFCVKTYDTESLTAALPRLLGAQGQLVCLQNGVRTEGVLAGVAGPDRLVSAVLYVGARRTSPGAVVCTVPPRLILGPYRSEQPGGSTEAARRLKGLLDQAGIECSVEQTAASAKWQKFLFNCGLNPLTAVTGTTMGRLLAESGTAAVFDGLVDEAAAVADAAGAPLFPDHRARVDEVAHRMDISSSMAEDLQAGRPVEVDAFSGYVVELGRKHGVPTPTTDVVHAILTARAANR